MKAKGTSKNEDVLTYFLILFHSKEKEVELKMEQKSFYSSECILSEIHQDELSEFFSLVVNWWKHNPQLPLNLYYTEDMDDFDYALEYLENKDYNFVSGNLGTNLKNLSEKRIKRKLITIE